MYSYRGDTALVGYLKMTKMAAILNFSAIAFVQNVFFSEMQVSIKGSIAWQTWGMHFSCLTYSLT